MNLVSLIVQIGKKYAIYLPKKVVEKLGVREGDIFLLEVKDGDIILKHISRELPRVRYWSKVTPREFEEIGEEISRRILGEENNP